LEILLYLTVILNKLINYNNRIILIAIIACCTIFFGSDNEDSAPNNSDPIEEVKFDELSCSTLLSNGDYSYHCSLNSATPAIFSTDPPISEVCYYPIGDTDVFFFIFLQ